MIVEAEVSIGATPAAVWAVMTDFQNAAAVLGGVEKIELLERPARGLVGLKWRETRLFFGKPADVEKWITEAVDGEYYRTRAETPEGVYVSTMRVTPDAAGCRLSSAHATEAQGAGRRFMLGVMGFLFRGVMRKALLQDLNDIKAAAERA